MIFPLIQQTDTLIAYNTHLSVLAFIWQKS